MSSTSTSSAPLLSPTTSATATGSATVSVGLAVGLVVCPVAFIFITVAFFRVARKGDRFARLPTERLRREQARQRHDYAKFMVRGTFSFGGVALSSSRSATEDTSPDQLPLPYSIPLRPPPPAYIRGTLLPPYDEGRSMV